MREATNQTAPAAGGNGKIPLIPARVTVIEQKIVAGP